MAKKCPLTGSLSIIRGKTFRLVVRSAVEPIIRKAISAIDLSAGCPRLTVTGHGLKNGWEVFPFGIKGTKQLNVEDPTDFSASTPYVATVIDGNTIEFNAINAAEFTPYISGGFIAYFTPASLVGKTCRVKFKDKVGGTVLLSTEIVDAPNNVITAVMDDTEKKITITIPASATETMKKAGVWEAETVDGSVEPVVDPLILVSPFAVSTEVVTP